MIILNEMKIQRKWTSEFVIAGLVLIATLPFLSRAVFLDEHLFLLLARSIVKNGLLAHQNIPTVFFGIQLDNLSTHTHPPVVAYALSILYRIFGGFDERAFRLAFVVFPLAAAGAFYHLARRFTASPLLVTTLFTCSPAFFLMSSTLMADVPALAFLLIGFACYLRNAVWSSSLFFALAIGCAYPAAIPVACLLTTKNSPPGTGGEFTPSRLPVVLSLALAVVWLMKVSAGEILRYLASHGSVKENAMAALSFIGGCAVFPWSVLLITKNASKPRTAGLAVISAGLIAALYPWPSQSYMLAYTILAAAGITFLASFFQSLNRESHNVLFGLWAVTTLVFFICVAEMMAARYLLFAMPPLYLVTFKDLRPRIGIPIAAATISLSLVLAVADYRFVNSYRSWVDRTIPNLQAQGFKVWSAAESGLRFYLEQRGIQTLHARDLRPRGADLIVRDDLLGYGLSEELEPLLIPLRTDELTPSRIQTLSSSAHAGFHDSRIGLLPFSFLSARADRVIVAELSPLVESLPQAVPADYASVPVWSPHGVILIQTKDEMEFRPRIPADSVVEYELDGKASIEVGEDLIRLRKSQDGPVVWRNLRILPRLWISALDHDVHGNPSLSTNRE